MGGMLGVQGGKTIIVSERDNWGTIVTLTYMAYIVISSIGPFWHWES